MGNPALRKWKESSLTASQWGWYGSFIWSNPGDYRTWKPIAGFLCGFDIVNAFSRSGPQSYSRMFAGAEFSLFAPCKTRICPIFEKYFHTGGYCYPVHYYNALFYEFGLELWFIEPNMYEFYQKWVLHPLTKVLILSHPLIPCKYLNVPKTEMEPIPL